MAAVATRWSCRERTIGKLVVELPSTMPCRSVDPLSSLSVALKRRSVPSPLREKTWAHRPHQPASRKGFQAGCYDTVAKVLTVQE